MEIIAVWRDYFSDGESLYNFLATQNEVSFDPSTGNIVISYNGTALFTHETTHAGQFETGDIAFDRTNGATLAGRLPCFSDQLKMLK